MINPKTLQGNWKEIQGKLKSKWSSLTDDDVKEFDGNVEQLTVQLQNKTGAERESIEQFFDQFMPNGPSLVGQVDVTVRGYAERATQVVQQTSQQAADSARERYAQADKMVRQSPIASLAYCFGTGVITGIVLTLLWRAR